MNRLHRFAYDFLSKLTELSLPEEGLTRYLEKAMDLFQSDLLAFVSDQIREMDCFLASRADLRPGWHVFKGAVARTLETK